MKYINFEEKNTAKFNSQNRGLWEMLTSYYFDNLGLYTFTMKLDALSLLMKNT